MASELIFEVTVEDDGGYVAACLNEAIVTQGDTWEELQKNVLEAVEAFFFDGEPGTRVRLILAQR